MTALTAGGTTALFASTVLMLLVLAVRAPVRRWLGPQLGYALWALPALRLVLPPLPIDLPAAAPLAGGFGRIVFAGPGGAAGIADTAAWPLAGEVLPAIWLAGAIGLFAVCALRHGRFCRRLRASGIALERAGDIRIIAADVDGPLAFGVFRRFIAVPRSFEHDYAPGERALVLAHERAHHARGDLAANWASLAVLAAHWWNPVAWFALRAFRTDQECAADARVLAKATPGASALYARLLARTAGMGALPVCNLNARSNLKGRLMMLTLKAPSRRRRILGGAALGLFGGAALATTLATAVPANAATGKQAVTIGVKPDGSGGYALIVDGKAVAPGGALPGGMTLPADFSEAGGCNLKPAAKATAMVIKGEGGTRTYTVTCASAVRAPLRATLSEGLVSLRTMRASVAGQPASAVFPETERTHALGAIDRSIREVEAALR